MYLENALSMLPGSINAALISLKDPLGGKVTTIWGVLINVLNIVIPLAAVLFVAVFVYAGISYIQSTGDVGKIKAAQAMMTNAVIGFIIVSFAFVILSIVQKSILGI